MQPNTVKPVLDRHYRVIAKMAGKHFIGTQTATQVMSTLQEKTIRVTLQMPVKDLKLVLAYLNPQAYAQWLKDQANNIKKTLKGGKDISEAQIEMLNHQMAVSLENLITNFKEQVCKPLQVDPVNDSKEIKLFKLRANKHVISVLEDINTWLNASLERISAPIQSIDEKVKEYDAIIKELKRKIKLLQTDKLSVEIHSSEEDKIEPPPPKPDLMESNQMEENQEKIDGFPTQHPDDLVNDIEKPEKMNPGDDKAANDDTSKDSEFDPLVNS